jgi:hypothetical protein
VGSGDVSPELTALYRRVMKRVHPDLAVDEQDRLRCEELTQRANDAYQVGDYDALRAVLVPLPSHTLSQEAWGNLQETVAAMQSIANFGSAVRERRETAERAEQARERELEVLRATSQDPFYVNYRKEQEFEARMGQTWQQYRRCHEDTYDEENNPKAAWTAFCLIACGELLTAKAFNFDLEPLWIVVGMVLLVGGSIAVRIITWSNADRRKQQALREINHIDQERYPRIRF